MNNTIIDLSYTSRRPDYRLTPDPDSNIYVIFRHGNDIRKIVNVPIDVRTLGSVLEIRTPYGCHRFDNIRSVTSHGNSRASAICARDDGSDPVVTLIRLSNLSSADNEALAAELNSAGSSRFYFDVDNE